MEEDNTGEACDATQRLSPPLATRGGVRPETIRTFIIDLTGARLIGGPEIGIARDPGADKLGLGVLVIALLALVNDR